MLKDNYTFNSFTTNDMAATKHFYADTLGLKVIENEIEIFEIQAGGSNKFVIYPKGDDHVPASFTVLNFTVNDIDKVVEDLTQKGITFEQYDAPIKTDDKGICRGEGKGPDIAWFKDPAGNILSIIGEE